MVYTANYFNFPSDQIVQYEAQVHADGETAVVIDALEKVGEKETQPTEVVFKLSCIQMV